MLIDYDFECFQQSPPSQITTNWILFQVVHILVTVKDDFASLIVIYPNLQTNRNYVVGEFSWTYSIYQVFNKGVQLNTNLPADISEFDTSNQMN
ncbi:hypothetical protein RhiirA5_428469 [Rhizophagus irregularis]|uniref:Uncharacterized protein n=1 Tax=Rhizophagus irregularis TaxID=588596 RepID=A0A2N0P0A5_9GLOM|nr:hypothetical protein RhiirA5_428469 [Rhizophagus irregularis]CAB4477379.1 unnamed protein product [Rhizophagus irregularis]